MCVKENPDKDFAALIKEQIRVNNGYCPCALQKNENTKCMCREFRNMVANGDSGACHCGLYTAER